MVSSSVSKNDTCLCVFIQGLWNRHPLAMVTVAMLLMPSDRQNAISECRRLWGNFPTAFMDRQKGKGRDCQNYSIVKPP